MQTPLLIVVVSGVALAALALLFRIEQKRERRFAEGLRRRLDRLVEWLSKRWQRLLVICGSGTLWRHVRNMHRVATKAILRGVRFLEAFFSQLERRQRRTASLRASQHADEHLKAMSAHKRDTALSDEERARLRDEMLEQ